MMDEERVWKFIPRVKECRNPVDLKKQPDGQRCHKKTNKIGK